MQGIGDVNTVCNGRKRQLNSLRVFNLHSRQTQRSLDRTCDRRIVEVVNGTQHPESGSGGMSSELRGIRARQRPARQGDRLRRELFSHL